MLIKGSMIKERRGLARRREGRQEIKPFAAAAMKQAQRVVRYQQVLQQPLQLRDPRLPLAFHDGCVDHIRHWRKGGI
jgi:hypothetical protein